jgi:hypothetical protein
MLTWPYTELSDYLHVLTTFIPSLQPSVQCLQPGWPKPSDPARVSQHGSRRGLPAKILRDVDTPLLLCNTRFYVPLSSLSDLKFHNSRCTYVISGNLYSSSLAYDADGCGSILNEVIFNQHIYYGFVCQNFIYFFLNICIIYFLSSFLHIRQREKCNWLLTTKC